MAVSVATAETVLWVSTALISIIMVARLAALRYRRELTDASSYIVVASLLIVGARAGCNHFILQYESVSAIQSEDGTASQAAVSNARIAGILTLIVRLLITTFYWLQCALLLLLYRRLLGHLSWIKVAIHLCWALLGSTLVAVVLTTLLECRPLHLYWQLEPDPGDCARAYGQLLVQCLSNIAIDILLLVISAPMTRARAQDLPQKLRLIFIYILGFFCIIVTAVRIRYIYATGSAQNARSFWASIQAVVAAFVANLPAVYGTAMLCYRRRAEHDTHGHSDQRRRATLDQISLFSPRNAVKPAGEECSLSSMKLALIPGKEAAEHLEIRPGAVV